MTIENIDIDKPKRREVLVRLSAAGLCHSDLHFIEGSYPTPMPVVLGHESAGIVEAVGEDVTYLKPGDHVISCLSVFCGHCELCLSGHLSLCTTPDVNLAPGVSKRLSWKGGRMNQFLNLSSFAEQMVVHEHALVKVRPDMPLDLAALIGCSVITGYGAVAHTARIEPGSTGGHLRRRRHRPGDHQLGRHCRCWPHHRHRQGPVQAGPGQGLRRHRRDRRVGRRDGGPASANSPAAACITRLNASA